MVFPILIRWHLYIESPPSPPPPLPNHPSSSNNNTTNSSGININIIIRSCSNVCPGGNDIRNWSMPGRTEPPSTAGIPGRNISAVANHDTGIKMPLCVYSRTVWIFTTHLHIQWSHSRNKDNRKDLTQIRCHQSAKSWITLQVGLLQYRIHPHEFPVASTHFVFDVLLLEETSWAGGQFYDADSLRALRWRIWARWVSIFY